METKINFGYLVFLSVVAALGGFLFGYDTAVISGTIAQVTQLFQLDSMQQGWYVGCALVGSIAGVFIAGILSDMSGRKRTMIFSAVLFSASAVGCAFSADFNQLVIYRIIGGVGLGIVSIVSPLYISEVSVATYRGRLVSLYQVAITVGFLGAYITNYFLLRLGEGDIFFCQLLDKSFVRLGSMEGNVRDGNFPGFAFPCSYLLYTRKSSLVIAERKRDRGFFCVFRNIS